jgi:hypothetical protein
MQQMLLWCVGKGCLQEAVGAACMLVPGWYLGWCCCCYSTSRWGLGVHAGLLMMPAGWSRGCSCQGCCWEGTCAGSTQCSSCCAAGLVQGSWAVAGCAAACAGVTASSLHPHGFQCLTMQQMQCLGAWRVTLKWKARVLVAAATHASAQCSPCSMQGQQMKVVGRRTGSITCR